MKPTVSIEVVRESLHFSAAHFTIFSATERERLHGHNFRLQGIFEGNLNDDGLVFDYGILKDILQEICDLLDERFLLPMFSPHLEIRATQTHTYLTFDGETMSLPHGDVVRLPLANITVESLASWIAEKLAEEEEFTELGITKYQIKVASGSGQWGVVTRS